MPEVLSFAAAKKRKEQKNLEVKASEVLDDIMAASEVLLKDWCHSAERGEIDNLLSKVLNVPLTDYVQDLNLLAHLESQVGIQKLTVYSPKTFINSQGWLVTFSVPDAEMYMSSYDPDQDNVFMTPEMHTENHARAFAVMLYKCLSDIVTAKHG